MRKADIKISVFEDVSAADTSRNLMIITQEWREEKDGSLIKGCGWKGRLWNIRYVKKQQFWT